MFLLIIGSRPILDVLSVVVFTCAHCGQQARQRIMRQQQKLTLFFLPLFSLSTSWFVECEHCGTATALTREQAEHSQRRVTSQGGPMSTVR